MKKILFLIFSFSSFNSWALVDRHQVSFGAHGLGWSASHERMEGKKASPFDSVAHIPQNLALNYAYRFSLRWQAGAFFSLDSDEYKFKNREGRTSKTERTLNTYGLFTLYNFDDHIQESLYLGLSLSMFSRVEETSHDFSDAEGKAANETDDQGFTYELSLGKRWQLLRWNIHNLSCSPQFSLFYRTHGKDFDDQDFKHGYGVVIQPLKFDLIF